MLYKLANNPQFKYSSAEKRLFSILSTTPKDTLELADAFFANQERPLFYREAINSALANMIRKVDANIEPFRIVKSRRRGPQPIEFHLAPREANTAYIRARLKAMKTKVDQAV